jgi:hypothetical protein
MASAGLAAVGRHRVGGVIPIDALFSGSIRIGEAVDGLRRAVYGSLRDQNAAS